MKRLLGVVLMLALATPVSAKTLIVSNTGKASDATYGADDAKTARRRLDIVTRVFDRFGASYVVVPPSAVRTEFCRTGTMVWDFGTSAARTEQFDAVIHLVAGRRATGADFRTTYNPESLSTVTKMPTVPQLFVAGQDAALAISNGSPQLFITAAGSGATNACSLGVIAPAAGGNMLDAGVAGHDEEGVHYPPNSTERWGGLDLFDHFLTSPATVVGKGYRVLSAWGAGPIAVMGWAVDGALPANMDSVGAQAAPDTVNLFMIQNTHFSGAKPNIVMTLGDGSVPETNFIQWDPSVLMLGLAALDSAAGGMVFDNKAKLPYKVAITVDGLCARSSRTNSGGIVPSDTARFYATIDSLAAYRIPFVFGVNLDSASTYSRDIQYAMANAPLARFSPQTRAGIDSAAAGNGIAHRYRPVDTFRRYRNIHQAVGPFTGNAADTSLAALLRYSLAIQDSLTPGRVSKFALPVDDDWSPYNLRGHQADKSRGATVDSVLYAYYAAGFRGIRINGAWHVARPNKNPNNPRGYIVEEGRYRVYGGGRLNLLAHNGGNTFGNRFVSWGPIGATDSIPPFSPDAPESQSYYAAVRFWLGMAPQPSRRIAIDDDADENQTASDAKNARILKLSCQELAGPETQTLANPSQQWRPGWWAIRKVVMPISLMNKLAGRSIMQVAYPEDITP